MIKCVTDQTTIVFHTSISKIFLNFKFSVFKFSGHRFSLKSSKYRKNSCSLLSIIRIILRHYWVIFTSLLQNGNHVIMIALIHVMQMDAFIIPSLLRIITSLLHRPLLLPIITHLSLPNLPMHISYVPGYNPPATIQGLGILCQETTMPPPWCLLPALRDHIEQWVLSITLANSCNNVWRESSSRSTQWRSRKWIVSEIQKI